MDNKTLVEARAELLKAAQLLDSDTEPSEKDEKEEE